MRKIYSEISDAESKVKRVRSFLFSDLCRAVVVSASVIIILFAAGCFQKAYAFPSFTERGSNKFCVEIEKAEAVKSYGISGECTVAKLDGNSLKADIGTLTMPGAYVQIMVTIKNNGTVSANLVKKTEIDSGIKDIIVRFPDFNDNSQEVIVPDKAATSLY